MFTTTVAAYVVVLVLNSPIFGLASKDRIVETGRTTTLETTQAFYSLDTCLMAARGSLRISTDRNLVSAHCERHTVDKKDVI